MPRSTDGPCYGAATGPQFGQHESAGQGTNEGSSSCVFAQVAGPASSGEDVGYSVGGAAREGVRAEELFA